MSVTKCSLSYITFNVFAFLVTENVNKVQQTKLFGDPKSKQLTIKLMLLMGVTE